MHFSPTRGVAPATLCLSYSRSFLPNFTTLTTLTMLCKINNKVV